MSRAPLLRSAPTVCAVLVLICAGAPPSPAAAQAAVIGPGREAEVVALLAPYALGGEVPPGAHLAGVAIERSSIVVELEGPGSRARVTLVHPSAAGAPSRRSLSFAIEVTGTGGARRAAERVAQAIEDNDREPFWRSTAAGVGAPPESAQRTDASLWLMLAVLVLGAFFWRDHRALRSARREGREPAPAGVWGLLALVTLTGVIARLWLAPQTLLGAWPFSRESALVEGLWSGRALPWIAARLSLSFSRLELTTWSTLVVASMTPPAVYALARSLGLGRGASLSAALALACLPLHVRFSRSEVAFIPSLLWASLFFVQLLACLRARTSVGAAVGLASALALAPLALSTRPLDLLLAPLALGLVACVPSPRRRFARRAFALAGVAVVAFVITMDHLLAHFGEQVSEGLRPGVLVDAASTVFSDHDTLLNPGVTPPALPALGLLGALWLAKTRSRLALWLGAWLGLLYVAHAYVVPREVAMQARYQLHLAVPFSLLVGAGVAAASHRYPRALAPLCLLLCLSPVLARPFLEDVAFDSQRELAFVREAAASLEPGATVLEYDGGQGLRFGRLFQRLDGGEPRSDIRAVAIDRPGDAEHFDPEVVRRALGAGPLYVYQGLPCLGLPDVPHPRVCQRVVRALPTEAVMVRRFAHRAYDANIAPTVADGAPITLRLYRVLETAGSHALDHVDAEQP